MKIFSGGKGTNFEERKEKSNSKVSKENKNRKNRGKSGKEKAKSEKPKNPCKVKGHSNHTWQIVITTPSPKVSKALSRTGESRKRRVQKQTYSKNWRKNQCQRIVGTDFQEKKESSKQRG